MNLRTFVISLPTTSFVTPNTVISTKSAVQDHIWEVVRIFLLLATITSKLKASKQNRRELLSSPFVYQEVERMRSVTKSDGCTVWIEGEKAEWWEAKLAAHGFLITQIQFPVKRQSRTKRESAISNSIDVVVVVVGKTAGWGMMCSRGQKTRNQSSRNCGENNFIWTNDDDGI